jgi:hypothetical protein
MDAWARFQGILHFVADLVYCVKVTGECEPDSCPRTRRLLSATKATRCRTGIRLRRELILAFHPALRETPTSTALPRAVDTIAGRRTSFEMAVLTWFTVLFGEAPIDGRCRCYVWFRPRTTVAAR